MATPPGASGAAAGAIGKIDAADDSIAAITPQALAAPANSLARRRQVPAERIMALDLVYRAAMRAHELYCTLRANLLTLQWGGSRSIVCQSMKSSGVSGQRRRGAWPRGQMAPAGREQRRTAKTPVAAPVARTELGGGGHAWGC
jgi:hypothetical protein